VPARWRRFALPLLLAGAAGIFSYAVFPGGSAVPAAAVGQGTSVSVGAGPGEFLGARHGSSYGQSPAPAATTGNGTPKARHKPVPALSPSPAARTAAVPAPSAASLAGAAGLGIYDGRSSPGGIETAANWLGSATSIKYAEDFVDATDFSRISDPWQLKKWRGSPFTLVWGVPMVPCGAPSTQCATNVPEFGEVADGGADGYYATLARNLVSAGFGSSYIRLGWEFNGTWMGWSICNPDGSGLASWAGDFVPAFRNIVTSMRSVTGADFKFIWNPIDSSNADCPGASLEDFYPGDEYVDVVALDVYDGIGQATGSDAARWADLLNGVNAGGWTPVAPAAVGGQQFEGYGLDWLAAFAQEHRKQAGLPEWGLDDSGLNAGGGDDAYFVNQVANWIKDNSAGPAVFWNYGGGTLQLNIPGYTSGDTPAATAAFKAAFGG